MTGIDFAILGIIFFSTLIGTMRGFTKELLSVFNWGGAAIFAIKLLPYVRAFMHPYIANPMIADWATIFCLFIIGLITLSIIANVIGSYTNGSSFKGIDHSLGFGFGIVRGAFIISGIELLFSTFSPRQSQSALIQNSRFVPLARRGGDALLQILPVDWQNTIIAQAHKVESQVQSKLHENLKMGAQKDSSGSDNGAHIIENTDKDHNQPTSRRHNFSSVPADSPNPNLSTLYPDTGQNPPGSGIVFTPPQAGQPAQPGKAAPSSSSNLGQPLAPQDQQSMVDELAILKPRQSAPAADNGYTSPQQNDLNRLIQNANGG